jgi:hypothetical protein
MDADDRPTNATDDTPLPLTLFAQMLPSFDVEDIGFICGVQNKEKRDLWLSDSYADTATWDGFVSRDVMLRGESSTHFSTRTSPISAHILTCVPTQSPHHLPYHRRGLPQLNRRFSLHL